MSVALFAVNAAFCALNIALYVLHGNPWSLAAAALAGLVAVFMAMISASGR